MLVRYIPIKTDNNLRCRSQTKITTYFPRKYTENDGFTPVRDELSIFIGFARIVSGWVTMSVSKDRSNKLFIVVIYEPNCSNTFRVPVNLLSEKYKVN